MIYGPAKEHMAALNQLKSSSDISKYCDKKLEFLAKGTSRRAYALSESLVIKIAPEKKGVAQNKTEANPFFSGHFDIYCGCVSHAKDYRWIVSHRADPFKDASKLSAMFMEKFSYSFPDFVSLVKTLSREESVESKQAALAELEMIEKLEPLYDGIINKDLMIGDFKNIPSWGVRRLDEELVIVDYGLTKKVYKDFYSFEEKRKLRNSSFD